MECINGPTGHLYFIKLIMVQFSTEGQSLIIEWYGGEPRHYVIMLVHLCQVHYITKAKKISQAGWKHTQMPIHTMGKLTHAHSKNTSKVVLVKHTHTLTLTPLRLTLTQMMQKKQPDHNKTLFSKQSTFQPSIQ